MRETARRELSWMILTIGHLSMNAFWGETERRRGPLCTSTLVRTDEGLLLIDPSVPAPGMPDLLNDQAGVTVEDVRHVFLTHFHGDHRFGLEALAHATWWMARPEVEWWRERAGEAEARLLDRINPLEIGGDPGAVAAGPLPRFSLLFTPGHTPGHTALAFEWRGQRVVVAADSAMTEAYFRARQGFHNSADHEQAQRSIDALARSADLIIPGHGNAFWPALVPEPGGMWTGGSNGRNA